MDVGLQMYKRTSNPAESHPMILLNKSYAYGQLYNVPLHRNDKQCVSPPPQPSPAQPSPAQPN